MNSTLILLCCLLGLAAACAPHSPGCSKLRKMKAAKCNSAFGGSGATCSEATISKNGATCAAAGAILFVDNDDIFGGTNKLYCKKNKWRYMETDPVTGASMDGPIPGNDIKVACVVLPPLG